VSSLPYFFALFFDQQIILRNVQRALLQFFKNCFTSSFYVQLELCTVHFCINSIKGFEKLFILHVCISYMKKIVLVTGGTSGIGRAICNVLTEHGHVVYGTGRSIETGQRLDGYTLVQMNVNEDASVKNAVDWLLTKEGKIDVLINNAGTGMAGSIEDSSVDEIVDIFNTNVAGLIRTCQAVLPAMRSKRVGMIINISSVGGLMGLPYRGIYCASKSAVETITESLSQEIMQFGIKAVLIEPGDFKTNINENRYVSEKTLQSDYKSDFERIHRIINEEVAEGDDPELIGRLVAKIIRKKKPRMRYNVGNTRSKLALSTKRILRDRWFEKLMMNHYKMKRKP